MASNEVWPVWKLFFFCLLHWNGLMFFFAELPLRLAHNLENITKLRLPIYALFQKYSKFWKRTVTKASCSSVYLCKSSWKDCSTSRKCGCVYLFFFEMYPDVDVIDCREFGRLGTGAITSDAWLNYVGSDPPGSSLNASRKKSIRKDVPLYQIHTYNQEIL